MDSGCACARHTALFRSLVKQICNRQIRIQWFYPFFSLNNIELSRVCETNSWTETKRCYFSFQCYDLIRYKTGNDSLKNNEILGNSELKIKEMFLLQIINSAQSQKASYFYYC